MKAKFFKFALLLLFFLSIPVAMAVVFCRTFLSRLEKELTFKERTLT